MNSNNGGEKKSQAKLTTVKTVCRLGPQPPASSHSTPLDVPNRHIKINYRLLILFVDARPKGPRTKDPAPGNRLQKFVSGFWCVLYTSVSIFGVFSGVLLGIFLGAWGVLLGVTIWHRKPAINANDMPNGNDQKW